LCWDRFITHETDQLDEMRDTISEKSGDFSPAG